MATRIIRIVSGGQTGADQGGLDAAIECGISHGGWCPKGRKSEAGPIPLRYQLQEMRTADYLARTEANVKDSSATVIFTCGALEGGSLKTAQFAGKHKKPCLHVDLDKVPSAEASRTVLQWLAQACPPECTLNVAGSRASKAPDLHKAVAACLTSVIKGMGDSP
jgi:hypothetical protein